MAKTILEDLPKDQKVSDADKKKAFGEKVLTDGPIRDFKTLANLNLSGEGCGCGGGYGYGSGGGCGCGS